MARTRPIPVLSPKAHAGLVRRVSQFLVQYTEENFNNLEKHVVTHYIDTFFLYFGRAPTLPRQLNHNLDPTYVPEDHARVSMTCQGVYIDISNWE